MKLTDSALECQINLNGESHYPVPVIASLLKVSPDTVHRYFKTKKLTKRRYNGRNICAPASEVHAEMRRREGRDR
jgi:hypothetical protein